MPSDPPEKPTCAIRPAVWPQDLDAARSLLRHYQAHLLAQPTSIRIEGYETELEHLATRWAPPDAALLLASVDGVAVGCIAVHLLGEPAGAAEVKRMWVQPGARGHGAGKALVLAAVAWAREHGATELLLDTVPAAMPAAHRLYLALGFQPHTRYNANPVENVAFFRLPLGSTLSLD